MRFGKTLSLSIYSPWKEQYIDYVALKQLLREHISVAKENEDEWTDKDETAFVEELINKQLEKVATFHASTLKSLKDETTECETLLEPLGAQGSAKELLDDPGEQHAALLTDVLTRLDKITKETNELEKYSRTNYTGFLKAAKKHDRKRGKAYRVGPLLRVRLAALPFNSEDYSPLLYRLTALYSFARQRLQGKNLDTLTFDDTTAAPDSYTAYKLWVHPENLLQVKTIILRRLPVLVYNPQSSTIAQGNEPDPPISSIYFDNRQFDVYSRKVNHGDGEVSSLRLRWYGQLKSQDEIIIEKKTVAASGESKEQRIRIKPKYVLPFIQGQYHLEKTIRKLQAKNPGEASTAEKIASLRAAVQDIQNFISENRLEPMVRANYSRMAFQIPGDDRVRISLDTNLAFVREDALDRNRPCRDPGDWHRRDVDDAGLEYPFTSTPSAELHKFPFAILEIKVMGNKQYEWLKDLMTSHLVKDVPRFSKFIHGTSNLFDDYVNVFPFWKGLVESDIRIDPETAFQMDQERKAKVEAETLQIGSLFGASLMPSSRDFSAYRMSIHSPLSKSPTATVSVPRVNIEDSRMGVAQGNDKGKGKAFASTNHQPGSDDAISDDEHVMDVVQHDDNNELTGLSRLFPSFSFSNSNSQVPLPPGVRKPDFWIKDQGPLQVECKIWLANQRNFVKWQHITVLLVSLAMALFNAPSHNDMARVLAYTYMTFALFAGAWGYGVYMWRFKLIKQRSPREFDNRFGPVVISVGLAVALTLNFVYKFQSAISRSGDDVVAHFGEL